MKRGYFITGTDTNVGKTWATLALMQAIKDQGKTVIGMKPVAAGCVWQAGQWVNDDALAIQAMSSQPVAYSLINPYAYELPVSPHLANPDAPVQLTKIITAFEQLQAWAEVIVVEGAGGWYTPINTQQTIADLAQVLALPVILVVSIRLGCLNHARLSYEAIQNAGVPCVGWVAVYTEANVPMAQAVCATLINNLPVPLFGILPYMPAADFSLLASYMMLP